MGVYVVQAINSVGIILPGTTCPRIVSFSPNYGRPTANLWQTAYAGGQFYLNEPAAVDIEIDAEAGSYVQTGADAELEYPPTMAESATATDTFIAGAQIESDLLELVFAESAVSAYKEFNVTMSEGAIGTDTPGRTWNPINSPSAPLWTLIETP